MILSDLDYVRITELFKNLIKQNDDFSCFKELHKKFHWIPEGTLQSIFSECLTKRAMMRTKLIKKDIDLIMELYSNLVQEDNEGVIINLAKSYNISPLSIVHCFLDRMLKVLHLHEKEKNAPQKNITKTDLVRDPTLISDGKLAHEVYMATIFDMNYGSIPNILKMLVGEQFECYLQKCLTSCGLTFKTEKHLRHLKYSKTPDVVLDVPIAINNQVVKWIESKALFADMHSHLCYIEKQYQYYYKRWGPGLVIYWFGHLSSVQDEKGKYLIMENFPKQFVRITDLI